MPEMQFVRHSHLQSFLFSVGVLLITILTPSGASNFRCIEKERNALLEIFPNCKPSVLFNLSDDCCTWSGVYCNNFTGRVYRLDVLAIRYGTFSIFCSESDFHFHPLLALEELLYLTIGTSFGTCFDDPFENIAIPGFIGSFSKLRYLTLSCFEFIGTIPPQLGNLTRLKSLEIYNNIYFDNGPNVNVLHARNLGWLSHLTSLKHLVLQGIDLSEARDLIQVVNNLPSLTHLDLRNSHVATVLTSHLSSTNSSKSLAFVDLSKTKLQSSSIWTWLFNHSSSLHELYLSDNGLTGPIPYGFKNMTSLTHLDLSSNQLKGTFQLSVQGLCKLQTLDLSRNNLSGDLSTVFHSLSCAEDSLAFLTLHHNNLKGSLPDITNFSALRKLLLQRNKLDGSLFPSFAKPSSLVILNLQQNQLTGPIPDLSMFRALKVLQLQNNQLNGTIHLGLGLLSLLENMDISSNSLKGSIYGDHFSNLSNLKYLDMSFNSLTFNISFNWIPPFRLQTIGLAFCKLGSRFPQWLQTQRNYSRLDMSNTGISDTFPFWFWNLSSAATFIVFSRNNLYGVLPNSSIAFSEDPVIDLSSNLLEGKIPSFLSNGVYLNLSRNSFSGPISFLCQRLLDGIMLGLDLSHNFLSGKLPNCWTGRIPLVMDLSSNNFYGNIPSSFGSLNYMENLHLRDNLFSGKLHLSLANFTNLVSLDLGDNLFYGDVPTWIGHRLPNLTVLSLRNNRFSGRIPLQLCKLSSLQILDLSMNNFSGIIPHCLCNFTSMTRKKTHPIIILDSNGTFASIGDTYEDYISLALKGSIYEYTKHLELVKSMDLSSNKLGGIIPAEISCLSGLVSLNLSRNNLSGSITPKIGELKSLESLDLSHNHLSGQIPATLSELNFLGTLSVANNNLSGEIPSGTQIQGFNASVFAGNPRLCGDPLPKKCIRNKADGKDDNDHKNTNHDDEILSLGLYISIVLGFITGFQICLFWFLGSYVC